MFAYSFFFKQCKILGRKIRTKYSFFKPIPITKMYRKHKQNQFSKISLFVLLEGRAKPSNLFKRKIIMNSGFFCETD